MEILQTEEEKHTIKIKKERIVDRRPKWFNKCDHTYNGEISFNMNKKESITN